MSSEVWSNYVHPTGWFTGYTSTGGNITLPSGQLESITVNVANTGDIQEVIYSILEKVADVYSTLPSSGMPPSMTVTRSSTVPSASTLRKSYTVTLTLDLPATQVSDA